jgi:hypothetical protein
MPLRKAAAAGGVRFNARIMPMCVSIVGPSSSATSSNASIAACHSSASCPAFGSSVMYSAASRKVTNVLPLGNGTGSSNARDQSVTRDIVIIVKAGRHTWRVILVARITFGAGHTSAATLTRMRASPRPLRMVLANPTAIFAERAFHFSNIHGRAL